MEGNCKARAELNFNCFELNHKTFHTATKKQGNLHNITSTIILYFNIIYQLFDK